MCGEGQWLGPLSGDGLKSYGVKDGSLTCRGTSLTSLSISLSISVSISLVGCPGQIPTAALTAGPWEPLHLGSGSSNSLFHLTFALCTSGLGTGLYMQATGIGIHWVLLCLKSCTCVCTDVKCIVHTVRSSAPNVVGKFGPLTLCPYWKGRTSIALVRHHLHIIPCLLVRHHRASFIAHILNFFHY